MNGATTEPLVSTISPPKIVVSTSAGMSQNFFRASMNAAMSFRNDIEPSERLFERLRGRAAFIARNPIGVSTWAPHAQRVHPEDAHHQAGWHNGDHIHPPE